MARVGRREMHSWKRERDRFERVGLDGRIILKCIIKKLGGDVYWIYLAQDREK